MTDVHTYALHLANTLRDKHFPDSPWTPADTTLGLLMQIDNMTSTLVLSETHVHDRIERRLDRLYTKLVTEPAQRQEAAIAAHKAEMDIAHKLNEIVKADPMLNKAISGHMERALADHILAQPDPAAVMRYLYLGPGRSKLTALSRLPDADLSREMEAISRRISTVKQVVSEAMNAIYPMQKNKGRKQGTEDK